MTPAEIAARLTPARKRALMDVPQEGISRCLRTKHRSDVLYDLHLKRRLLSYVGVGVYRLTPLGQAVRAVLEQEQSDG